MNKLSLALVMIITWAASAVCAEKPDNAASASAIFQLKNAAAGTAVRGILDLDISAPAPALSAASYLRMDDRYWVTVAAADRYARTRLLEAGMDIVEIRGNRTSGFVHKAGIDLLESGGFVIEDRLSIYEYAKKGLKDFPAADAAYHNYAETTELLRTLAARNEDIASLFSLGKTLEGREIWCLRLNPDEKGETSGSRPGAFYIGNHHAREHLTNEVALGLAVYLLDNRNSPEIKRYLETFDIYIVPLLNADGAEYDVAGGTYRWWRKNTRINSDKSTGVDLNRNYDALWCQAGASHRPGADTYCGSSPFSEPETLAVKRFIGERKNIRTLMSYHSYSGLLLYPWAGKDAPVENEKDRRVFEKMAKTMTGFTGYTPQQASDLYTATGDTMDWAYASSGIFSFTTELEGDSFYPGAGAIERAVAGNIKAAVYLLSVTDDPYKVLD